MSKMACVYIAFSENDEVLYVGKSINVFDRLKDHCKEASWFKSCDRFEVKVCENNNSALELEKRLILELKPKYNITYNKRGSRRACAKTKRTIRNALIKNHLLSLNSESEVKLSKLGLRVLLSNIGHLQLIRHLWSTFKMPFDFYFYSNWPMKLSDYLEENN